MNFERPEIFRHLGKQIVIQAKMAQAVVQYGDMKIKGINM